MSALDIVVSLPIALFAVFIIFSAAYSSLRTAYEAGSYEKTTYIYSNLSQNMLEYGLLNQSKMRLYPLNNQSVYQCRDNFCRVVCLNGRIYLWVLGYENTNKS